MKKKSLLALFFEDDFQCYYSIKREKKLLHKIKEKERFIKGKGKMFKGQRKIFSEKID